jgi:allophanate hydrolase
MSNEQSLLIRDLARAYRDGTATPRRIMEGLLERSAVDTHHLWITRLMRERVMEYVAAIEARDPGSLPLYGIPFVIKDNIDLAGIPTTAGCAEYAYTPKLSAHVVQKLIDAGAIPLGKTNLDQFATGLVGTR